MTLDKAIEHAEEVAEEKEKEGKLLYESEAAIIRCLECASEHRQLAKWLKDYKRLKEQEFYNNENSTVKDIAIAFQFGIVMGFGEKYDEMDKIMEEVKKVITPKPKIGRWINNQNGTFECSKCGIKHSKSNYCPNCGVKMIKIEE